MRSPDLFACARVLRWSAGAGLLQACSLFNTVPLPEEHDSACELALPPEPPAASDLPSTSDEEPDLIFAMRESDFGNGDDADGRPRHLRIGYDLDGRCTRGAENQSCEPSSAAAADSPDDGEGGRDNALGRLAYSWMSVVDATGTANQQTDTGNQTTLVRIRGYNGAPNDDQVEVAMYVGTLWASPADPQNPRWDGNDRWHVSTLWVKEASARVGQDATEQPPRFADPDAYVVDRTLVARFERVPPGNAFASMGQVWDVVLTAPLEPPFAYEGSGWTLGRGTVSGLVTVEDYARAWLAPMPSDDDAASCSAFSVVDFISLLCAYADLRVDGDSDKRCNALSVSRQFEAEPAKLGDVFEALPARDCLSEEQRAAARCEQ